MRCKRSCVFVIALALFGGEGTNASNPSAPGERNLALHNPYAWSIKPSYHLCKDAADETQLTDGDASGCDWRRKSTVGWARESEAPIVTIDLGRSEPIQEVRLHTVGGGRASVLFPSSILVMVSDDNSTFHAVGAADSLGLAQDRADPIAAPRTPHVLSVSDLRTRGRYVLCLLEPDGDFAFLDEIEVLRGEHDPSGVEFAADNRFRASDSPALLPAVRERSYVRTALSLVLSAEAGGAGCANDPGLAALRDRLTRTPIHRLAEWRKLDAELAAFVGQCKMVKTGRRLAYAVANPMWQSTPYDGSEQSRTPTKAEVHLSLWQGEHESAALDVFNNGASALRIRPLVRPQPSPDSDTTASDKGITLRAAVPVDARGVGRIGDALVRISPDGFELAGGRAGQIWITFHDPNLAPGAHRFTLDLLVTDAADPSVSIRESIPLHIDVAPVRFPDRPRLKTFAWSYLERTEITSSAEEEAMADLRAHHINTFVLFWSNCVPMPTLKSDGRVEFDFDKHDAAIQRYHGADPYLFYWGLSTKRKQVPGLGEPMTPQWKTAIREWLIAWVAHLKKLDIGYERFAMYPFDETLCDEFYDLAKFIKTEVDPRIRIFANSRGVEGSDEMSRIAPYIDIWCFRDLPYGARIGAEEQRIRHSAAVVWSYDCARPAKGKPPYDYYRLQMWRAFARGDTGCGFWVYADPGATEVWNDFATMHGRYGVVYGPQGRPEGLELAVEPLIPSRRWEAWREGVEDYEYLAALQDGVSAARRAGHTLAADQGQETLERAVKDVLEHRADPEAVYDVRRTITQQMMRLQRLDASPPPRTPGNAEPD